MDPSTFSHQFCGLDLEQQLALLQRLPEGVTLETVLSTIFDLSIPRQQEIFEQVPFEVQQSWVSQLTSEQKQILLERAAACELEESDEVPEDVINTQSETAVTVIVKGAQDSTCTIPTQTAPSTTS